MTLQQNTWATPRCDISPSEPPEGHDSALRWYHCAACDRHFTEQNPTINPSVCIGFGASR